MHGSICSYVNSRDGLIVILARSSFVKKLEGLSSRSAHEGLCALLYINLDGFTAINDQ